jgi:hypothetical protein
MLLLLLLIVQIVLRFLLLLLDVQIMVMNRFGFLLALLYIVIGKVLFALLKIRCFMREQSTLTSDIILFEMLLL